MEVVSAYGTGIEKKVVKDRFLDELIDYLENVSFQRRWWFEGILLHVYEM